MFLLLFRHCGVIYIVCFVVALSMQAEEMSRYTRETESLRAKQEITEEKLKFEHLQQVVRASLVVLICCPRFFIQDCSRTCHVL